MKKIILVISTIFISATAYSQTFGMSIEFIEQKQKGMDCYTRKGTNESGFDFLMSDCNDHIIYGYYFKNNQCFLVKYLVEALYSGSFEKTLEDQMGYKFIGKNIWAKKGFQFFLSERDSETYTYELTPTE